MMNIRKDTFCTTTGRYAIEQLKARRFEIFAFDTQTKNVRNLFSTSSKKSCPEIAAETIQELPLQKMQGLQEEYPSFLCFLGEDSNRILFFYIRFDLHFSLTQASMEKIQQGLEVDFLKDQVKNFEIMAYQDDVTNLFNQRKLYKDIDDAISSYHQNNIPFSVLFIDIDHFKQVNDGHGHLIGSSLLVEVGNTIASVVRDCDFVYRYGGDEFVVLCPNLEGKAAFNVGERILNTIKEKTFTPDHNVSKRLSVSIGISEFADATTSKKAILQLADDMMYTAKKNGRGQVCFINDL